MRYFRPETIKDKPTAKYSTKRISTERFIFLRRSPDITIIIIRMYDSMDWKAKRQIFFLFGASFSILLIFLFTILENRSQLFKPESVTAIKLSVNIDF